LMSDGDADCTTRLQNAHRTEELEVLYRWHPWAGCIVQIHEVVAKASGKRRSVQPRRRSSARFVGTAEMFDRAMCAPMRVDSRPRVEVAALDALTVLLAEVTVEHVASSNALFSGATSVSRNENRGASHAVPAPYPSRPSNQDRAIRSIRGTRARGGADPGVGLTSGGDPPGADSSDGSADPRPSGRCSCSAAEGDAP
jgi:hypothetical protein